MREPTNSSPRYSDEDCVRTHVTALGPKPISTWVQYPTDWTFLWSSPEGRPFLGLGACAVLTGTGLSRTTEIRQQLADFNFNAIINDADAEPPEGTLPRFVGAHSFFPGGSMGTNWKDFPSSCFVLPRVQLFEARDRTWATVNQLDQGPSEDARTLIRRLEEFEQNTHQPTNHGTNRVVDRRCTPENSTWRKRVDRLSSVCETENLLKIVLAQQRRLRLERPISLQRIGEDFTSLESETFNFMFRPGTRKIFLGSSPERLVSRRGQLVETESLAGTIESDRTVKTRDDLAEQLTESVKDQREHDHVVKYLKNRLSPLVSSLETVSQSVRSLPTLQHLLTGFRGKLHTEHHVLELVRELHPTPAVAGRPTGRALSELRNIESFDRGLYAAPIGWFDRSGNGTFAVGIRSAQVSGTHSTLYAGAGIIPDSKPSNELEELDLKFRSIRRFILNKYSN